MWTSYIQDSFLCHILDFFPFYLPVRHSVCIFVVARQSLSFFVNCFAPMNRSLLDLYFDLLRNIKYMLTVYNLFDIICRSSIFILNYFFNMGSRQKIVILKLYRGTEKKLFSARKKTGKKVAFKKRNCLRLPLSKH